MEPATTSQQSIEDLLDENCRLRHGVNVYCLTKIFRNLDILDLDTVGEMNGFYKRIIGDLVIP